MVYPYFRTMFVAYMIGTEISTIKENQIDGEEVCAGSCLLLQRCVEISLLEMRDVRNVPLTKEED